MKVLLIHNFYEEAGGEDTVFESEKKLLIDSGHDVFVFTDNNNSIKTTMDKLKVFFYR